jgi:hypothetical protein
MVGLCAHCYNNRRSTAPTPAQTGAKEFVRFARPRNGDYAKLVVGRAPCQDPLRKGSQGPRPPPSFELRAMAVALRGVQPLRHG